MTSEESERGGVEDALRRIEAGGGDERRSVTHSEPTVAEMLDLLETVRNHGMANFSVEPEPEPFEALEVIFVVPDLELDVRLNGEAVQFNDEGAILQFAISERTGVQIDRAVEALAESEGGDETSGADSVEEAAGDAESEASDPNDSSLNETNPFLQGASDTLGGGRRRSGPRKAVTADRLDAYIEGSDSASDEEPPDLAEPSEPDASSRDEEPTAVPLGDERSDTPFRRESSGTGTSSEAAAEPGDDAGETREAGSLGPLVAGDEESSAVNDDAEETTETASLGARVGEEEESSTPADEEESAVGEGLDDMSAASSVESAMARVDESESEPVAEEATPDQTSRQTERRRPREPAAGTGARSTRSEPQPPQSGPADWWESYLADAEPVRLEADDFGGALAAAAKHGEFGVCSLEGPLDTVRLVIDGPEVYEIDFVPPRSERSLGWLFCRAKKLSRDDLERAIAVASDAGISVPAALVREGLLAQKTVEAGRRARLRELLPEVRERDVLGAEFRRFDAPPEELTHQPISLRSELFGRVYREAMRMDDERFEELRGDFVGQIVRPVEMESFPVEQSPLDDRQARFVDKVLVEPKSFDQLVRESTMYEKGVLQLVAALERLGWVALGDWDEETKTKERKAQKLVQLKTRLEGSDRFDQFDVHWTAHTAEVEATYEELSEDLEALEGEFEAGSHEAEELERLREECEENYEFLANKRRRREYRRDVKSKFQIRSAIQLYEDQLEQAQMQRDIPTVRDHCNRLLELDSGHEEAKVLLSKIDQLESSE